MASFADIAIRFGADLKQFSSEMQNAQRKLNTIGKRFTKIGAGLTLGVTTPLVALGGYALSAAADFETLQSRLEVALGSSSAAEQTFKQIAGFTKDLAITTEDAAESYIKLKNLGLDPTIAALKSYGNTAAAQGKSINQLIEAVADASTGEFERLKEFGIKASKEGENVSFTFQGLSTTIGNNAQEIQGYLQNLGNTTFSGSLEAQANTFNGLVAIIKDNVRTTLAEFGKLELDAFKPLLTTINGLFDSIRELSPETKKFLVVFGGIAAAVGPLLALAGTILPAIGAGFALLTGPIGLIAAGLTAIGVIIYKNWEPIKDTLRDLANYFIDLYNESFIFRTAVEGIVTSFKNVYATGKFLFSALGDIISAVGTNIKNQFKPLGAIIKAILTGDIKSLPTILAAGFEQGFAVGKDLIADLKNDFAILKDTVTDNISSGINNALRGKKYELLKDNVDVTAVGDAVSDAVKTGLENGALGANNGPFTPQTVKLDVDTKGLADVGNIDISGGLLETLQSEKLSDEMLGFIDRLSQFRDEAADILTSNAANFASGFGELIGSIAAGTAGIGSIGALLLNTMADIVKQLGQSAIKIGLAMKALKLSFSNPATAIIAGVGLIALSALLKSVAGNFAGNFSDGGFVGGTSFSGDKLIAGVNSGELILNIAQQKNLAGVLSRSGSGNVTLLPSLKYEGDGFRIMLNKVDVKRNRFT